MTNLTDKCSPAGLEFKDALDALMKKHAANRTDQGEILAALLTYITMVIAASDDPAMYVDAVAKNLPLTVAETLRLAEQEGLFKPKSGLFPQ